MKNLIALFAAISLLLACDEEVNYDFFVKNNCDKAINVSIVDYMKVETNMTIVAKV